MWANIDYCNILCTREEPERTGLEYNWIGMMQCHSLDRIDERDRTELWKTRNRMNKEDTTE